MLVRDGITVSLIQESDGQPFPTCRPGDWEGAECNNHTSTIRARNGSIFYPQIKIAQDFEWRGSNILAVRIDYAYSGLQDRMFEFPWITRPKTPQTITVDFKRCYLWDGVWKTVSSQFACYEVSCIAGIGWKHRNSLLTIFGRM